MNRLLFSLLFTLLLPAAAVAQITSSPQTVNGPLVVQGNAYVNGGGLCVNPLGSTGGNAGGICTNAQNSQITSGGNLGFSIAGTLGLTLGTTGGATLGNPTGGMPSVGVLNAQGLEINGVPLHVPGNSSTPAFENILSFGAKNDGSADVSAALNSAIAAAQANNAAVYVPPGQYLLTQNVSLQHIELYCQGQPPDADAGAAMGKQGATFWLTSTTNVPFTLGLGVKIRGCNFYWPNQNGVGTPITVGASPFTYNNTGSIAQEVNITGGTVSSVVNGGVSQAVTAGTFNVPAGSSIVVTYSAAPGMSFWQPIVYPALFSNSLSGTGNIDLIDDRVINAYDVFDQLNTDASMGNIHLDHTYGYAIHDWLNWTFNAETSTIVGMSADINLFQDAGFGGNNHDFAAMWTNYNGNFLDAEGDSTTQAAGGVGGISMTSSAVFGYGNFLHVGPNGVVSESTFSGNIIDGAGDQLLIAKGGCAVLLKMHNIDYNYNFNPGYANGGGLFSDAAKGNTGVYSIQSNNGQSCTDDQIDLSGDINTNQGDVIDITGNSVKGVNLHDTDAYYGQTGASGNFYILTTDVNTSNLVLTLNNNKFEPDANYNGSTRLGVYLNNIYSASINGNTFNGVYNSVVLNYTGNGRSTGKGNVSVGSPAGSYSITGTSYGDVHAMEAGNMWGVLPAPTASACGTGCAMGAGSNDISGEIAVGTGTVTSATMTFASQWPGNPVCTMSGSVGPLYISSLTTTAITFNSGATNMASSQIYYHCQGAQ